MEIFKSTWSAKEPEILMQVSTSVVFIFPIALRKSPPQSNKNAKTSLKAFFFQKWLLPVFNIRLLMCFWECGSLESKHFFILRRNFKKKITNVNYFSSNSAEYFKIPTKHSWISAWNTFSNQGTGDFRTPNSQAAESLHEHTHCRDPPGSVRGICSQYRI